MTDLPTGSRVEAPAVEVRALSKSYLGGDGRPLHVLDGVDLQVASGESVAVIGQSGVGKSTLLHLVGGLDRPSAGEVLVDGRALQAMDDAARAEFRNTHVGFVFQFHHLLREFSALENVAMPLLVGGLKPRDASERARAILTEVGLERRMDHNPAQLSGGEQQRVAVARALVTRPRIVLADEPSGNLDPATGGRLHDLFFEVSQQHGAAMILVTHSAELAARADRVLRLEEGQLVQMPTYQPETAEAVLSRVREG
jgi:lipoprotein-releasing system ATP-binding protein